MPKRMLDQVLIVDIEATCWAGPNPEGQESEIIEIGLCLLEVATRRRHSKCSILVRPERSAVSPFCTQLTGLTQEQVEQGISFAEACSLLQTEYASHRRVWASYGDADRLRFAIQAKHLHVDTTSFSVNGAYDKDNEHIIAITHGYSRDHREDLKQWMLALATTHQGDIPLFLQPLSGNSSDKASLVKVITDLHAQLQQQEPQETPIYVADSGLYSTHNMQLLNRTNVQWVSRIPAHQQRGQSGPHPA